MYSRPRQYSVSSVGSYNSTFSHAQSASTASVPDLDRGYRAPTAAGDLPCEFVGYTRCEESFGLDEFDAWVEHIVSVHLLNLLPKKVICWFCDDEVFDCKRVDRETNFRQRMWHIHGHFQRQEFTVNNIRPDHHLNAHLWKKRLIDEGVYIAAQRYDEVPQAWILPHDAEAPDRQGRDSHRQVEYTNPHEEARRHRRHHQNRVSGGRY
ncbi:hypothetical protein F5Y14DRAFT_351383 [Nemania sp. NC0429]|nr:hypothetical protein F5Y14DRAFT_351383 [Nemania sp. NC0429]